MKRFSIRSKSDSSTLASSRGAPDPYEDVEKAEKVSLLPSDTRASEFAQAQDTQAGEDHGLKLLSLGQVDGVPPVGTLIFIHGLGGHFTRTWSHERDADFFWPKIWLPTADGLRAVRIMSFGYDAAIFRCTPSLGCVSDFARTLLLNIMVFPGLNDDKVRPISLCCRVERRINDMIKSPIILVAHSMGGLIAKEVCKQRRPAGSEGCSGTDIDVRHTTWLHLPEANIVV